MLYYLQHSHGNFIIYDGIETINIVKSNRSSVNYNDRTYVIRRTSNDYWGFFPNFRIQSKDSEGADAYSDYGSYGYYVYTYKSNQNKIIKLYNSVKYAAKNSYTDKAHYEWQLSTFADSSKCFCVGSDQGSRQISLKDEINFRGTMINTDLTMRIHPKIYYSKYLKAIIDIEKIVSEDHLSKIQNIQINPSVIIDKIE